MKKTHHQLANYLNNLILIAFICSLTNCSNYLPKPKKSKRYTQSIAIVPLFIPAKFPGSNENYIYYYQENVKLNSSCFSNKLITYNANDVTSPYYPKDTTVVDTTLIYITAEINKRGKLKLIKKEWDMPDSCQNEINAFFNNMPNWNPAREWNFEKKKYLSVKQTVNFSINVEKLSSYPKIQYPDKAN
jgi:hypothetical protein